MSTDPQSESGNITDLVGVKPLAKSVEIATKASVDAASALFERICLPAAKEFGLLLKDKVHAWRQANIVAISQNTEGKMDANKLTGGVHAHPRIVNAIIEQGSWSDDAVVQDLWAGLLSSSCTETGDDESNLIFTTILADMTKLEARILKYACETANKVCSPIGKTGVEQMLFVSAGDLMKVTGESDLQRLSREVSHLRGLSLLSSGSMDQLAHYTQDFHLTPTSLALDMYVRCQGSRKSPAEYFGLS